jgi:CPA1 family monovalent cation:H+ antiporter
MMVFWSLVDEVLNALLFTLIGFEVVAVVFRLSSVLALLVDCFAARAARNDGNDRQVLR